MGEIALVSEAVVGTHIPVSTRQKKRSRMVSVTGCFRTTRWWFGVLCMHRSLGQSQAQIYVKSKVKGKNENPCGWWWLIAVTVSQGRSPHAFLPHFSALCSLERQQLQEWEQQERQQRPESSSFALCDTAQGRPSGLAPGNTVASYLAALL